MHDRYKIVKIFEKKDTRFTALIEYKNKKAILKQLTTTNKSLVNNFLNEVDILRKINKPYVPKVYEYSDEHIVMEYFEAYDNTPSEFSKYATPNIVDTIIDQLINVNTKKLNNIKKLDSRPLFSIYKTIARLLKNGNFNFFYFNVLCQLTLLYFKNKSMFNQEVATKGDFTEVNILIRDDEVKFIDFDSYRVNGFWLQDASYLLLHQDVEVEKLSWQKDFFKKYILKINGDFVQLNAEYIRFWLLHTSINQFAIRCSQHNNGLISLEETKAKEGHIKYFLDDKKFDKFMTELGVS